MARETAQRAHEPLWYKDAIIYELHIKSFYDSDGDGMGDFKGLIEKLDYLKDLGVTAIWLLPFYPSPLRDDGYDIADYGDINPDYGNLKDLKKVLKEAHKRGMRVITELVLNHTSDQHAWFQASRRAPEGSEMREYYVWSKTSDMYQDARIIFKDFETSNWAWDPVAKAYYWHRFYSHQPDLNYDNPKVHGAMLKVIDYWLKMGVDGLRLDAVPYLYEREGSNCENLPETHAFLKKLRAHVDRKFSDRMLLAEANQWPEDSVAYFGEGDSCHMAFHFPLMPRMFMALQMEDRYPIIDILEQTPEIPETAQWAVFLRNHDELTLEMVSDEERDYMYKMYARDPKARINLGIRRRLAPLLNNDRKKIELLNVILFSMPGTPVLYYGDELGMGDNYYLGDRDGVRTPMQWSSDRNAGFSRANPQRLFLPVVIDPEYHYEAVNVENQQANRSSLLWWMKSMIAMRKRYKAFSRGTIEFLMPHNPKVLVFVRHYQDETLLVVANLSRYPQAVSLDLSRFSGLVPEEVFSRNRFPQVREAAYSLTLNAHGYYIFDLVKEEHEAEAARAWELPVCARPSASRFLDDDDKQELQQDALPRYLIRRGWMGSRTRLFKSARILETIPMGGSPHTTWLIILEVVYLEGRPEIYNLLLTYVYGDDAEDYATEQPHNLICHLRGENDEQVGVIMEGLFGRTFCEQIVATMARAQTIKARHGEISIYPGKYYKELKAGTCTANSSTDVQVNPNHTVVVFEDRLFFKIFRLAEPGLNPDLEMVRFLTEKQNFQHTPKFLGAIEYTLDHEPVVVAVLKEFVHSETDAWSMAVDGLGLYFDRVVTSADIHPPEGLHTPMDAALGRTEGLPAELFSDSTTEMMTLLGRRTAELHKALAADHTDKAFAPEPFSTLYQRSVYQALQSRVKRTLHKLENSLDAMPEELIDSAKQILGQRGPILERLKGFVRRRCNCMKIRVHGDYHLHHILHTGRDFLIINFEGKESKSISERRLKRSALRDVGDMLRSLHHCSLAALTQETLIRPEDREYLEPWAEAWRVHAGGLFLRSYLDNVAGTELVPDETQTLESMLEAFLLEKAFLELNAELSKPTGFMSLPLAAIRTILG